MKSHGNRRERKIDFGDHPEAERGFSAHRDEHWNMKAANPRHPLALRVYFAALGHRRVGGHAPFAAGELAELLVNTDAVIPDRRRVAEAIRQCVKWGYLAEGSNALCLVVPLDDIRGGRGEEFRCRRSHKTRTAQSHRDGCACARCAQVSVSERTPDPQVSVSDVDTLTTGVRPSTDNLSGGSLLSLPTATTDRPQPERTA